MDKRFLTEEDYNQILNCLEEQQKLFNKNENDVEILNAKYFAVLFQAIYNGIFSSDKEAVDNIICALTTDDVTVMEDKASVRIKTSKEVYTVDIPKNLGIDMLDVGSNDIYSRNRHGVFRVKTVVRSDKSIFKTPVKRFGTAKETTSAKYLYKNSKKIFDYVFGEDTGITFKSIYFSGIFNRVKKQGVELTYDGLMNGREGMTNNNGRKIFEKECERVRAGNPYSLIRWFLMKTE